MNVPSASVPGALKGTGNQSSTALPTPVLGGARLPAGARAGLALLLALAVAMAYGPAYSGGFVYDDLVLVRDNPRLESLGAVLRSLREPFWSFEDPQHGGLVGFWRPLTVATLALGRWMGGGEPLAFHLLSMTLHVLASLAVWRLARRLLKSDALGFLAALLFGLHPVHVESVAWISAVNDPLYALFAVLSLDAFVAWRGRGSQGMPLAAALWFVPALLAKEQALAVLPAAAALDVGTWIARRRAGSAAPRPILRAYGPLLLVVALYLGARMLVFASPLAGLDRAAASFGLSAARGATYRVEVLGGFLALLAWPADLSVFRMVRPSLPPADPAFLTALAALTIWIVLCAVAWWRRAGIALACLLLIPMSVAPVIVHYQAAGAFPLSDRYLYLAVAGWTILLALAASRLLPGRLAHAALVLVALPLGWKTWTQSAVYADEETFFRAGVESSPRNPYVRWGLGRVLLAKYEIVRDKKVLDEAFFHYMTSLALGTDYGEYAPKLGPEVSYAKRAVELAQIVNGTPPEHRRHDPTVMVSFDDRLQANLGQGYCYLYLAELPPEHDYDAPLIVFQETAKRWPTSYHAHTALGTAHQVRGEYQEAKEAFAIALRLNPAHAEAWYNLAQTLVALEDWDGARNAYQAALKQRPGHLPDLLGIARSAMEALRFDIAERRLDEAMQRHPDSTQPLFWRGMLEARQRRWRQALSWFDRVLAAQPRNGQALLQKGKVLYQLGEVPAAVRTLQEACEVLPESFEAHYQIASILLSTQGDSDAAFRYIERAYFLSPEGPQRTTLHDYLAQIVTGTPDRTMEYAALDGNRGEFALALDWIERTLVVGELWEGAPDRHRLMAQVFYLRGKFLQALQRGVSARDSYERALELNPEHVMANHNMAILLFTSGEPREVTAPYASKVLELLPASKIPREFVGAMKGTMEGILAGRLEEQPVFGPELPPEDGGR